MEQFQPLLHLAIRIRGRSLSTGNFLKPLSGQQNFGTSWWKIITDHSDDVLFCKLLVKKTKKKPGQSRVIGILIKKDNTVSRQSCLCRDGGIEIELGVDIL